MAAGTDNILAATLTASSNTPGTVLSTGTMLEIFLNIATGTGTVTDFDIWIERSPDNGATWFKTQADVIVGGAAGSEADIAARTNIVNNKTSLTAEKYWALYRHVPAGLFRLAWNLTGTTPSYAVTAYAAWK